MHYLPLRGNNKWNPLNVTIREPANRAKASLPLTIRWQSDQPLGLLQWHSSLDGDLGAADGELGTRGTIRIEKLRPGTHYITLHAYSSPALQRDAQTVTVTVDGGHASR